MSQQASHAPISVMVVEDDPVTLKSLCLAIESEPALKLAATAIVAEVEVVEDERELSFLHEVRPAIKTARK